MANLTIVQVLFTCSKMVCSIKKIWTFLKKKIFLVIFRGRRPGKKCHFPALPWCLSYLNITFTFTPVSSNCSIYHCCNPSITNNISNIIWQSYLLSCAFGQLIKITLHVEGTHVNIIRLMIDRWYICILYTTPTLVRRTKNKPNFRGLKWR